MSKYNKVLSIPIESIPEEEIGIAIKEWAEGDESLEKLLWACYNKGLMTDGSHAGSNPYISFVYDCNASESFLKMMNATLSAKGTQILIHPDGGNPFSGPNWYKPNILLGSDTDSKVVADQQFETITKAVNNPETVSTQIDAAGILYLLDFLIGKLTNIQLRIRHDHDDNFTFSVERSTKENTDIYHYLNERLLPLGFKLVTPSEGNYKYWEYTSKDPLELTKTLLQAAEALMQNFLLDVPTSIDESDRINIRAHIARTQMTEEQFEEWLKEERKRLDSLRESRK